MSNKVDPLLPLIVHGRSLALNNNSRAQLVAQVLIDVRDMRATRLRIEQAVLEQIEFAQAEAIARQNWSPAAQIEGPGPTPLIKKQ